MTKRKRRKGCKASVPAPFAGPPPEPVARRPKARGSVEDPLLDWPDDERESDRWILERVADDMERD